MKTKNVFNKGLIFLILFTSLIIACNKDNGTTPTPVDYTKYKLKQTINNRNGNIDTTVFTYNGESVTQIQTSNTSATIYTRSYIKNGNKYDIDYYTNANHTHTGFYNINAAGYMDTSAITSISSGTFNNRDKNYYNTLGQTIRAITNYNSYENDIKYFYNTNNDYSYWIYDQYNFSNPTLTKKDSVVIDYYLDKPLHVSYEYALQEKYGKLNTHLIKKRTYYDLLNSNAIRLTYEYEYETDSIGLVTKRIFKILTQPGNVLNRADTTYYSYYNN